MIYEIHLKAGSTVRSTNVLIEAPDKERALSIFKKQRIHETGVSKKDYVAAPYKND